MTSTEDSEILKTLFQYQHGFLVSKIMFTAAELGVFDLLRESEEPLTAEAIAEGLGTSRIGMQRLLEACVGLKLLRMEMRDNKGFYGNTALADLYLAKSSPKSQYSFMQLDSEFYYPSFQNLADVVREGKNQIRSIHESSVKDFFRALYRSEEGIQLYFGAMKNAWTLYCREIISECDLSQFRHICDLGGGSGIFAEEHILTYPNSSVTIFDLPEVVEKAKKNFEGLEESRISFQGGDFFKDSVPEADLYILSRILHLWDDEKCMQLLTKLYKACKPGGGVLVIEPVLDEERVRSFGAHFASIKLLVHTDGKTRTPSEHKALLTAAGFKEIQAKHRSVYGALLGRK
uniref:Acetylserotonin O-methyltransferase n=1 Tax=Anolis carolinensis TaxID=28377 RepID=H9GTG5_ANOCA|nr:PREDICTED: acetylserotonin O-methyltransferase [Anolis carolinensis]|eukprot:XP_016851143.1 PREDICTED: acetylserotonin O-methyltransferase [Anolis carolinensis]